VKDASQHVPSFHPSIVPSLSEVPAGDAAVPRLELIEWAQRYGLVAGITTRPLSLGLWSDEPVGQVIGRWRAFRAAFGARFPAMVLAHQVHGTDVHWYESLPDGWLILDGIDGHATNERGVLLTITVADCIPLYLTVPQKGAIALLHAGWRGTADGILEQCVELLKWRGFGLAGTVMLDLRTILTQQARALGIEQITVSPWCSAEERDRFFSHRASGGRDGRMVAYLGRALG